MNKLVFIFLLLFVLEEKLVCPTWEAGPKEYTIKADGKVVSQDPIIYEVLKTLQDYSVRIGKLEKK